jgi:hypothetical protein
MKRKIEIAFSLMMVVVFAFAIYEARDWQLYARLLPWVVGLPMLGLAVAQFALDIRDCRTKVSHIADSEATSEIPAPTVRWRTISIIAWIISLFLAIFLLGFSISIPLFTFLYLKIESDEKWWFAILLSVVAWGFFFGFFKWAVSLPFPQGQLFRWLAL